MSSDDPVLRQRATAARLAATGQRIGYLLFGIGIVAFLFGVAVDFSDAVSTTIVVCLVVGSIFLAPAIVLGYAVKAAVRDDLEHGRDIDPSTDGTTP